MRPAQPAARPPTRPRRRHAATGADPRRNAAGEPRRRLRQAARRVRWGAILLPALPLLAVILLELGHRTWTIRELVVVSPMVAATLAGPYLTAVYAALAVGLAAGIGWYDNLDTAAAGGWTAQLVRLGGVAIGGIMAILASRYNAGRETTLANVRRVAETAQRAILTDVPPTSRHGLRLAVRYESAAAEASVGGDLYDVVDGPRGMRIMVGDARGKGLDAVRLASRVLGCFRVVARGRERLGEIVPDLDAEVASVGGLDDFVTAVVAELTGRRLTLVNAGHPDPVLWRRGRARLLAPADRQPPLGLGAGSEGPDAGLVTVALESGDRLLFYTDGIAEARERRTRRFFPLLPAVERALNTGNAPDTGSRPDTGNSLDAALAALAHEVRDWTGSGLGDDVALLAVEVPVGLWPACGPAAAAPGRTTASLTGRLRPGHRDDAGKRGRRG